MKLTLPNNMLSADDNLLDCLAIYIDAFAQKPRLRISFIILSNKLLMA